MRLGLSSLVLVLGVRGYPSGPRENAKLRSLSDSVSGVENLRQ